MREMHRLSGVVKALGKKIAIVTDGRFSGADSGLMVGYITPEAADRGPIGIVKNDDRIRIDLDKRSLDVLLSEGELAKRLQSHQPMEKTVDSVLLRRYQRLVGSAAEGAIWGE
jgi:dihydroxy-acid dehydratase